MLTENQKNLVKKMASDNITAHDALAKDIESAVNTFALDIDELAETIMRDENAKRNFTSIAAAFAIRLSECFDSNNYDGRNERACEIASVMCKNESIALWLESMAGENGKKVVFHMRCTHRTLQQSFASVCFRFIAMLWEKECKSEYISYVANALYTNWWKTPLI
jgi:hypothetical protein